MLSRVFKRNSQPAGDLNDRLEEETERARRLVIYDQDSGLLARWYLEFRLVEESNRSRRYTIPFVLLTISLPETMEAPSLQATDDSRSDFHRALTHVVRETDLAARLGENSYACCLLHCNSDQARLVIGRLAHELSEADFWVGLAVFPDDAVEGPLLIDLARGRSAHWRAAITGDSARAA
jgi:GGDEF domain-containing protein